MKRLLALAIAILLTASLLPASQTEAAVKPSVTVSKKTIYVGGTSKITVKNAKKGYRVVYKTSNSKVIAKPATKKLSKTGCAVSVKGKKAGKSKITVYVQRYYKKKWRNVTVKSFTITVKKKTADSGSGNSENNGSGNSDSGSGSTNSGDDANGTSDSGSGFTVKDSTGSSVSGQTVDGVTTYTIAAGGSYTVSGETTNTQIDITSMEAVTLNLSSAVIDNSALSNKTAVITQENDITTTIISTGTNRLKGNATGKAAKGVIYAEKGDFVFEGTGTLSLIDGLAASPSDSAALQTSDGIRTKKGSVTINSSTVSIDTYGDGIQAKKNITISGGIVNITTRFKDNTTSFYTTGTGSVSGKNTISENEGTSTKTEYVNIDTGSHKGLKAGEKAESVYVDGTYSADESTSTASGNITISGGTVNIDTTAAGLKANKVSGSYDRTSAETYIIGSPDDGIQSNNSCTISGGTVNIASGDDGISAATTLDITGNADITISKAYEGIEAAEITVGTGNDNPGVSVATGDDGINAASKTVSYYYVTEDGSINEDYNYKKVSTANTGNTFIINSGNVYVRIPDSSQTVNGITYTPDGDGIDCNGSFTGNGGNVEIYTLANTANSPLDSDSGTAIKGATVFASGASGMDQLTASGQGIVYYSGNMSAGSEFSVKNGETEVYKKPLPQAASYVYYTSPAISEGTTYTVNGESCTAASSAGGMNGGPGGPGGFPVNDGNEPGGPNGPGGGGNFPQGGQGGNAEN